MGARRAAHLRWARRPPAAGFGFAETPCGRPFFRRPAPCTPTTPARPLHDMGRQRVNRRRLRQGPLPGISPISSDKSLPAAPFLASIRFPHPRSRKPHIIQSV